MQWLFKHRKANDSKWGWLKVEKMKTPSCLILLLFINSMLTTNLHAQQETTQNAEIDKALQTLLGNADIDDFLETRRSDEIRNGYYQVREGDSLDGLIRRIYRNSIIRNDILQQAFIHANPHAFRNRNPNWLLAGSQLRIPQADDVMSLVFKNPDTVKAHKLGGGSSWVRYP